MRIPAGQMSEDVFKALGAEPVTINSSGIYEALKTGRVDAQENPLGYMNLFRHYEVMKYVSTTNHMWSGFNMLAHLPTWKRLPGDIKAAIERNARSRINTKGHVVAGFSARWRLAIWRLFRVSALSHRELRERVAARSASPIGRSLKKAG